MASNAHKPITEAQKTAESLTLLRAATWYYRRAKRWHALRVAGMVVLALAGPVILFWKPSWGDWVGAVAGLWILLGRTLLLRLDERDVSKAAAIQEEFDIAVFSLEWNEGIARYHISPEDIHSAAERVHKEAEIDRLRNWYANADSAPWPLNVVLCQRSSAVWGRRNHTLYAHFLLAAGSVWFVAGIGMAVIVKATVATYLVRVFLPSQPAFLDAIDLVRGHLRQAEAKELLERTTTDLWNRGIQGTVPVSAADCRAVQDEAFRLRRLGIQIPQIVYRLRRRKDQAAMEAAVAALINQNPNPSATAP